jgi:hypothetical protein
VAKLETEIRHKMKILHTISIIVLLLVASGYINAAEPQRVSVTYEYNSNDRNESQALAEQHAFEYAKRKAIEEQFPILVTSSTALSTTEQVQNGSSTLDEHFYSSYQTIARGEWIGLPEETVLESYHNGEHWVVKVHVEGLMREKTAKPIELSYAFIRNQAERENRIQYTEGDTLLLRFQSPVDGALCLYLVDAEKAPTAYCLLPSETEKKGYQPVTADKKYTFLDFKDQSVVVNTSREQEFNTLYLLFSPNSFAKALDRKGGKNKDGDLLPRNLSYSDFQAWLVKAQTADEQMVVIREVIEIRKAK